MPPGETGAAWRKFNVDLAAGSDGYLAPILSDDIDILTVRCSHTSAAVRALMAACKTPFPNELGDASGRLSLARVTERSPSMQAPTKRGMEYTIIKHQLVTACPSLMAFLARSGNATPGAEQKTTALQSCKRLFDVAVVYMQQKGKLDDAAWKSVVDIAAAGMAPGYHKQCEHYTSWPAPLPARARALGMMKRRGGGVGGGG